MHSIRGPFFFLRGGASPVRGPVPSPAPASAADAHRPALQTGDLHLGLSPAPGPPGLGQPLCNTAAAAPPAPAVAAPPTPPPQCSSRSTSRPPYRRRTASPPGSGRLPGLRLEEITLGGRLPAAALLGVVGRRQPRAGPRPPATGSCGAPAPGRPAPSSPRLTFTAPVIRRNRRISPAILGTA